MVIKKVKIIVVDGLLQVCPDPVYVSVLDGDEVEWEIQQDHDFDVDFAKAEPFASHHFHGNHGAPKRSGPAKNGTQHKDYKYTVKVPGKQPLDPTVRPTP